MTYKSTIIIVSFITIIAALFTAWTSSLFYHPQTTTVAKTTLLPDASMENVTAIIMNKYGKPSMKIITPKMVHFAEDDRTDLTAPQLTLYRQSPKPWYVTSKHAKATQGVENVHFWEDVIIQHPADPNNPATLIKTTTLTVHPNKQTAETRDPITLIQPNIVVKATGMYADMNNGYIKLLSQSRGEYVPSY